MRVAHEQRERDVREGLEVSRDVGRGHAPLGREEVHGALAAFFSNVTHYVYSCLIACAQYEGASPDEIKALRKLLFDAAPKPATGIDPRNPQSRPTRSAMTKVLRGSLPGVDARAKVHVAGEARLDLPLAYREGVVPTMRRKWRVSWL